VKERCCEEERQFGALHSVNVPDLPQRVFDIIYRAKLPELGCLISVLREQEMLRIQRSLNGEVVFTLSGRIDEEHIAELETLIRSEKERGIVIDLKDVTLVGQDAISFLSHCEADGITLKNCSAYIREWITRERSRG